MIPKDFRATLTMYKKQITIMLTSRINGTETQKMGLLISFPLGELAAKKKKNFFFLMHLTLARITVPGI